MKRNYSKGTSILIIAFIYVAALFAGYLLMRSLVVRTSLLWALFAADVLATVIVWGYGIIFENVSVYDPYWSVIPPVVFTFMAFYTGVWSLPVILLLVASWYWGIRLTGNWAYTFKGLDHEDWRYTRYRESQSHFVFHLINFFGLNMMPTVLVFACMIPGLMLFESGESSLLLWIGFAICISAATIQLISDTQIHRFRKTHQGQFCNVGLWKNGRHPNYSGEILFWWGIWVMYASAFGIDYLVFAPIAMTALFLFISIPMMEKRQLANKPGYAEYRKNTRLLI